MIALLTLSVSPILVSIAEAQGTSYVDDPTDDLFYYSSGSTATTWGVIDIRYAEVSRINSTHIRLVIVTTEAIPLSNQWQGYSWFLDTGTSAPPYSMPIDTNDINVCYTVNIGWGANGHSDLLVVKRDYAGNTEIYRRDVRDHLEEYYSADTCSVTIPLNWIGDPTSIEWTVATTDGVAGSTGRHDKAPNTGHATLNLIPLNNSPFWAQWWFWTIIGLGIVATVSSFTTVHYRKKTLKPKEIKTLPSKPTSEKYIICPKCNAKLPIGSKFCGDCGTSLE